MIRFMWEESKLQAVYFVTLGTLCAGLVAATLVIAAIELGKVIL